MSEQQDDPLMRIHSLMENIRAQVSELESLVQEYGPVDDIKGFKTRANQYASEVETRKGKVIEGVFDGQNMVGPEEKMYTVPANYASKSKLVAGDIMKLTITDDGSFIYKQIGPVERLRVKGSLVRDAETGTYRGVSGKGKSYRLLTASVTYYKGDIGDTVVMLIPKEMDTRWATVDNIIHEPMSKADREEMPQEVDSEGNEVFNDEYVPTTPPLPRDFAEDFGDAIEFSLPTEN